MTIQEEKLEEKMEEYFEFVKDLRERYRLKEISLKEAMAMSNRKLKEVLEW